jgi:hypothetical protein
MLQFGAGLAVRSNPFCVNGEQFLSRNREMLGDMRDGGRKSMVRKSGNRFSEKIMLKQKDNSRV